MHIIATAFIIVNLVLLDILRQCTSILDTEAGPLLKQSGSLFSTQNMDQCVNTKSIQDWDNNGSIL